MRKIRVFQEDAYLSLDYQGQSGEIYRRVNGQITRDPVAIEKDRAVTATARIPLSIARLPAVNRESPVRTLPPPLSSPSK